ncbi:TnsA-like heteromeric transposase endonuclease subunit [Streptomyces sp. I6]|uniref:TnsA-like heteromeric transposase endonuclease subunit n=1 Tax=Streptomyces sp. I6 TaxID=2483113 RepID=UPI0028800B27|nr:TnsA-like heteromeric transposase endonuclease subunit [Streptomyces sp. I6]
MRPLRRSRGEHHFSGWYWAATTGRNVGFESRLERDRLVLMDFHPEVLAIASRTFRPHRHDGERERRHAPESFVRRADGSAVVVDVRTDERSERRHFGDSRMRSSVRRPMLLIAGLLSA